MCQRVFADVFKVKDAEMGRVAQIIQVGPILSHESLKAETLSHCRVAERWQCEDLTHRRQL